MRVIGYIIAIILLCVIIVFHELGHLIAAKANDIKVNEFWLGFGPTIFSFKKGETTYALKCVPFGGACVMEGEEEDTDDERSFQKKPVWARIIVIASGPVFNFLMALIFSVIIIASIGIVRPVVGGLQEGYPAEESGLMTGDEIVRMNSKHIHFYKEITMYTIFHEGQPVDVTFVRDGEKHSTTITPVYDSDAGRYIYGIYSEPGYTKYGPARTILYGIYDVKYWIQYTLRSLEMLVTNQIGVRELSGPVGIVKTIGDTYEESSADGPLYVTLNMLNMGVLISADLGVVNLLPIPGLDGGRLLFLVIEAIRGRRVKPERENMVHYVGLICMFGLMIFIVFNDIYKIFI